MPNQRDSSKAPISVYVPRKLREAAKKALEKKGMTFTEAVYEKLLEILDGELDREYIKEKQRNEKNTKGKRKIGSGEAVGLVREKR